MQLKLVLRGLNTVGLPCKCDQNLLFVEVSAGELPAACFVRAAPRSLRRLLHDPRRLPVNDRYIFIQWDNVAGDDFLKL